MAALTEIEGIGPEYASKLEAVGINSVEELLQKGGHTKDREEIASQAGLTYHQILEWVNRADLFRIKGIGSEYSDLLEFAGVDTVPELAQRNAANLTAKLAEVNAEKHLVRALPSEEEVANWIDQAKEMPRMVWYEARSGGDHKARLTDLLEIEGIGPEYKAKLQAAGIDSVEELLEKGAHTKDREDIAEKAGLTYHQILEWVNRADLFRIKGVGSEYSDLLEIGGVDTVVELAQRNPANLTAKLAETDAKTDVVRRLPTETEVTDWIAQAKELPRAVWYEARTRKLATDVEIAPVAAVAAVPIIAALTGGASEAAVEAIPALAPIPPLDPIPVLEPVPPVEPIPVVAAAPVVEEKKDEAIPIVPLVAAAAVPIAAALTTAAPITDEKKPEPAPVVERKPVPVAAPIATPVAAADKASSGMNLLWPLLFIAGLGLFAWLLYGQANGGKPKEGPEPVAAVSTPAAAPIAEPVAAALPAVGEKDVLALVDAGAKSWIEPAAEAFNKTRTDGKIVLAAMGSREGRDQILYDKDKVHPVFWSPGDIYWIGKIQADAADASIPSKSGASVNDPKALLNTYVVLMMPDEKAKVVAAAMAKPEFAGKTWKLLHQIATQGWASVGGPADWGKLKLAQTDPTKSNSGMAALTLMFQEWSKDNPGKDFNDKGFLQQMSETEGAAASFAPATSELIQQFVSSPGAADIAIVYESDAIRAMDSGAKGMKIIYPSPTAGITVPASVVKGAWVSDDQRKLGEAFVDYLLTDAVQEDAIKAGYRPASPALAAKTAAMATAHQEAGVIAAPPIDTPADTKTREGLIYNWNQWRKK